MDPLSFSPLGLLTFIAAPAMLTNASSIMTLGTGNRFARAIDRARTLSTLVQAAGEADTPQVRMHRRQLSFAERRALILVRALTAFYVSVGSFGAASLISLLGAVFVVVGSDFVHRLCLSIALFSGIMGVGGLVIGWVHLEGGPEGIRERWGLAAPLVWIPMQVIVHTTPPGDFVPWSVLNGSMFGPWPGTLTTWPSWMEPVKSWPSFASNTARRAGRSFVRRWPFIRPGASPWKPAAARR